MELIRTNVNLLEAGLARFDINDLVAWRRRCRPKVLVVTDGSLSFNENSGFGLWRFLHAITLAPGVSNKPVLTLAHRNGHTSPISVGADSDNVQTNFNFQTASPAVTVQNYDQIWIFGIQGGGSITDAEIGVIAEFMNSGGGVFATGDHATLGRTVSGRLPRIRHMREWSDVPMGTENDANQAVMRIDTVVNPGANGIYEFDDQSDDIPQRLYPNYKVTASGNQWTASIHPILMLPGAMLNRPEANGAAGFTNDIDVHPDHPHESVCYEVASNAVLNGNYNDAGLNFVEFQPSAAAPAQRIGADVVAFGVSGGRSVQNGVWKPPVKPRMFGVLSAYDGRLAQAYAGKSQRPGRIVCDSTWHHYVNINLDGRGSGRNGLGNWSGGAPGNGVFTPSAALEKIYTTYRNMLNWLQPANRIWCHLFWTLAELRFHPLILEEILEVPRLKNWRDFVALGAEARRVLNLALGSQATTELVKDALLDSKSNHPFADLLSSEELAETAVDRDEFINGVLGGLLAEMTDILPDDDDTTAKILRDDVSKAVPRLQKRIDAVMDQGIQAQLTRLEKTRSLFDRAKAACA